MPERQRGEVPEAAVEARYTERVHDQGRHAFVTCLRCGATLMFDPFTPPAVDPRDIHDEWHDFLARTFGGERDER